MLFPSDNFSTGTSFGIGMGNNLPAYFQFGSEVEIGMVGLGIGRQEVRGYAK